MSAQPVPAPHLTALPRVTRTKAPPRRRRELPVDVVADVCAKWGVTFEAVAGWGKTKTIREARADVAFALRERSGLSLHEVGAFLGDRDYSTIASILRTRRRALR